MRLRLLVADLAAVLAIVGCALPAAAQNDVELVVAAGRPLRIALDERVTLKTVGQPVTGVVTEPVYAYDRVVIPAGARVRGHVSRIDLGSKLTRLRAYLNGNFSPAKRAVIQFDALLLDEGRELSIETMGTAGVPHVAHSVAGGSKRLSGGEALAASDDTSAPTLAARARSEFRQRTADALGEAKQRISDTLGAVKSLKSPRELHRLKDAAVQQLPYHPQYLAKGTTYDAELSSPVSFGRVVPAAAAPAGAMPAPDSVLTARLTTTLDSSKTPRGTSFEAVLTQTVFSSDHQVVLPEGTRLGGEVTFAAPARRFHRNGRLRFLFERVQVPNEASAPLLGALHAIDASADNRIAVDDEGGATVENSKTRFIAPALSILSLRASLDRDGRRYADPDGDGSIKTAGSGAGSRGVGGFIGMGLVGAAVSQITRPVGIALGVYGAARTLYANVLGKGREVTFPANTPIQVRLAPGPSVR